MVRGEDIYFEVTRGKLKGQTLIVHQICNDWVTANTIDGEYAHDGQPLGLVSTYFKPADRSKLLRMEKDNQLGQMFRTYYDKRHFAITGKFRRPKQ